MRKRSVSLRTLRSFADSIRNCFTTFHLHTMNWVFSQSQLYLDTVIIKAYDRYPSLKHVTVEKPVFEKHDKTLAQSILRETAIFEPLNLKASILYKVSIKEGGRVGEREIT